MHSWCGCGGFERNERTLILVLITISLSFILKYIPTLKYFNNIQWFINNSVCIELKFNIIYKICFRQNRLYWENFAIRNETNNNKQQNRYTDGWTITLLIINAYRLTYTTNNIIKLFHLILLSILRWNNRSLWIEFKWISSFK